MKGFFITFEGSEGSGKSTQIEMASNYLKSKKHDVVVLREPGAVPISESIREILLDVKNKGMSNTCEMLLYMAARAQLVEEKIKPALDQGKIILCDRFLDSTVVYQGYGHGMDLSFIKEVGKVVTLDIKPNLTFIFDIQAEEGLRRIKRTKDRIEERPMTYHEKVREGYLAIAKAEPNRVKLIKVDKTKEEIHAIIKTHIDKVLK